MAGDPTMIGRTLAHYEITAHLGTGGMGAVYRARDTKLDREVALKTLLPELLDDPERIARFEREAKSLASLQHANVASIYGWENAPEARFLVMELVEGETLADRIGRGAVPVAEAVAIAVQITEGLGAAHDKGLVHRDLKPANVMLTADGQVKILDFGLARAWAGDGSDVADPMTSPTLTAAMTMAGTILGTAAYMSPEQARGQAADRRADIWATGVIIYEMLTGRRLFAGETVSDTLAAVLTRDPDLDALPAGTPPSVRRGLERCLARSAKERLHDVADLRLELLATRRAGGCAAGRRRLAAAASRDRSPPRWWWSPRRCGLYLGRQIGARPAAAGAAHDHPRGRLQRLVHVVHLTRRPDGRLGSGQPGRAPNRSGCAASTDSRAASLPGSLDAANPVFSPDGRWIAYKHNAQRAMYKVPVDGGSPQRLVGSDLVAEQLEWADDGYIYFAGGGSNIADRGVHRVAAAGGQVEDVTVLAEGEGQHMHPCRVPGTDWLLFTAEGGDGHGGHRGSRGRRPAGRHRGEWVDAQVRRSGPRHLLPQRQCRCGGRAGRPADDAAAR